MQLDSVLEAANFLGGGRASHAEPNESSEEVKQHQDKCCVEGEAGGCHGESWTCYEAVMGQLVVIEKPNT